MRTSGLTQGLKVPWYQRRTPRLVGSPSGLCSGASNLSSLPSLCPRTHSIQAGCSLQGLSAQEATWPAWPFPDPPSTCRFRDRKLCLQVGPQCDPGPVTKVLYWAPMTTGVGPRYAWQGCPDPAHSTRGRNRARGHGGLLLLGTLNKHFLILSSWSCPTIAW